MPRGKASEAARVAPQLLTLEEVGLRLGTSHDTVLRLIAAGDLPAVDISAGRKQRARIRVSEQALAAFIDARTLPAGRASS